jgi:hypothetical protein
MIAYVTECCSSFLNEGKIADNFDKLMRCLLFGRNFGNCFKSWEQGNKGIEALRVTFFYQLKDFSRAFRTLYYTILN